MNYTCSRCQDRTVVGGFMPAPCPECRAKPSDDPERLAAIILLWEQATADRERLAADLEQCKCERDEAVARCDDFDDALRAQCQSTIDSIARTTEQIAAWLESNAVPGPGANIGSAGFHQRQWIATAIRAGAHRTTKEG